MLSGIAKNSAKDKVDTENVPAEMRALIMPDSA
jgi:hypothetical protein